MVGLSRPNETTLLLFACFVRIWFLYSRNHDRKHVLPLDHRKARRDSGRDPFGFRGAGGQGCIGRAARPSRGGLPDPHVSRVRQARRARGAAGPRAARPARPEGSTGERAAHARNPALAGGAVRALAGRPGTPDRPASNPSASRGPGCRRRHSLTRMRASAEKSGVFGLGLRTSISLLYRN